MTVKTRGGLVYRVEPESLGEYLGVVSGDTIVSVNGHRLRDEIDFRFHCSSENIRLEIIKGNGEKQVFDIEKDPDDLLGISFDNPIFDSIITCKNNCSFCFISQLPPGMRRSLYLRDDDYRLSFLFGNFISLTNLSDDDLKRIDEQRLTPLRVSLHTSNPNLRARLMNNKAAGRVMDYLKWFKEKELKVHIQIVLLKGINDGKKLIATLKDLESLGDTILSVGVVPAIYTKYRKIPPSDPVDEKWANVALELIEDYARKIYKKRGVYWVYGADEFYEKAGRRFLKAEFYDDLPQYENGIGMVANFRQLLDETVQRGLGYGIARDKRKGTKGDKALAVTGFMAYSEVTNAVETLGLKDKILVKKVKNEFFGSTVTCAGLLTGRDILATATVLKRKQEFGQVLIPSVSVYENRFLDDLTVSELSEKLGLPVEVVEPFPADLLNAVTRPRRGGV